MLYLIEVNSVITVWHNYYCPDMVPEFWHWPEYQIKNGACKTPKPIFDELQSNDLIFKEWLLRNKKEFVISREVSAELVRQVISKGYGESLTDIEINQIGGDPFLIASALEDPNNRCVVTEEVSKSTVMGKNRRIPDICNDFQIKCINISRLAKQLRFKTSWQDEVSPSKLKSNRGSATSSLFGEDN